MPTTKQVESHKPLKTNVETTFEYGYTSSYPQLARTTIKQANTNIKKQIAPRDNSIKSIALGPIEPYAKRVHHAHHRMLGLIVGLIGRIMCVCGGFMPAANVCIDRRVSRRVSANCEVASPLAEI